MVLHCKQCGVEINEDEYVAFKELCESCFDDEELDDDAILFL
jgi:hypothetical protein